MRSRTAQFILIAVLVVTSHSTAAERRVEPLGTDDRLVFIHLNDLHANLVPHRDLVRDTSGPKPTSHIEIRGGLARIATLIGQIRTREPHTILMNIGDTYHGGAEALFTRGNAIVAPVNALGIDIGVPGNWDFAYGPLVTRLRYAPDTAPLSRLVNQVVFGEPVEAPTYALLGGNVTLSLPLLDGHTPLLPATHLMKKGGHSIGFIGITSDIIPRMSRMLAIGFEFLQGEQAYREYVNTHARMLREEGAEIVVVMSELGLHKDRQLADSIDAGVDIIFSAHTHELTSEPLVSDSGALVVEAGNDGFLGTMTVTFISDGSRDFTWNIIEVDSDVEPNSDMLALVAAARAPFLVDNPDFSFPMPGSDMRLTESIEATIGPAPVMLHRRHVLENPFNQALSESLRKYYETDIAITPGFRFDAVLQHGDTMTVEDSYRYLPVPPVLARGAISGEVLRELIEFELGRVFSADAFDQNGGWFMGLSGVELTLDLSAPNGKRVLEMRRDKEGAVIGDEEELTAVSCLRSFDASDALCGNRGFSNIQELESPTGGPWTAREFLQWQVEKGTLDATGERHIEDVSGSGYWPESAYIQPLH